MTTSLTCSVILLVMSDWPMHLIPSFIVLTDYHSSHPSCERQQSMIAWLLLCGLSCCRAESQQEFMILSAAHLIYALFYTHHKVSPKCQLQTDTVDIFLSNCHIVLNAHIHSCNVYCEKRRSLTTLLPEMALWLVNWMLCPTYTYYYWREFIHIYWWICCRNDPDICMVEQAFTLNENNEDLAQSLREHHNAFSCMYFTSPVSTYLRALV